MKVVVATPIADEAIGELDRRHDLVLAYAGDESLVEVIRDCEGLIFRSGVTISGDVIDAASKLRLIVRAGSGLDNIDLARARGKDIRVVRVPGVSPQAVAEFTMGLLLAAARNIARGDALVREGSWPKYELGGPLIAGKTLGIIGVGRIGRRTGELGVALGMRVVGCVKHPSAERATDFARSGIDLRDRDSVVAESDVVSVHTPLDATTRHLVDAEMLGRMKPGAVLLNTARGGVVDESAVLDALTGGDLSAAAFDVHESEGDGVIPGLASLPNVVLTPHIGAMAAETQGAIGNRVVELVEAFVEGRLDDELADEERVL